MPGSTEHGRRNMLNVALAGDRRLTKQRTIQMIDGAVEIMWPGALKSSSPAEGFRSERSCRQGGP